MLFYSKDAAVDFFFGLGDHFMLTQVGMGALLVLSWRFVKGAWAVARKERALSPP